MEPCRRCGGVMRLRDERDSWGQRVRVPILVVLICVKCGWTWFMKPEEVTNVPRTFTPSLESFEVSLDP